MAISDSLDPKEIPSLVALAPISVFQSLLCIKWDFSHWWRQWIMAYVTAVRYSVKFNGTLLKVFSPTRGLRQGDPLSPFLFLFVADGLCALLKSEFESNGITPVKVCRGAPGVSHLLLADDTLLFFWASVDEVERVKQTLTYMLMAQGSL
jgi:hypothetical protein